MPGTTFPYIDLSMAFARHDRREIQNAASSRDAHENLTGVNAPYICGIFLFSCVSVRVVFLLCVCIGVLETRAQRRGARPTIVIHENETAERSRRLLTFVNKRRREGRVFLLVLV